MEDGDEMKQDDNSQQPEDSVDVKVDYDANPQFTDDENALLVEMHSFDELEFTNEEKQQIVKDHLAVAVYLKAKEKIQYFIRLNEEKDRNLDEASKHLEDVLLHQSSYPSQSSQNYENLYLSLRREYDNLMLNSVKLTSELESLKKTTGHALSSLSKARMSDDQLIENNNNHHIKSEDNMKDDLEASDSSLDIAALLDGFNFKMQINENDSEIEAELVLDFLQKLFQQKQEDEKKLQTQLKTLENDIKLLENQTKAKKNKKIPPKPRQRRSTSPKLSGGKRKMQDMDDDEFEDDQQLKKKLFASHFEDISDTYFQTRNTNADSHFSLQNFSTKLSIYTKFQKMIPLATFGYSPSFGGYEGTNSISSIAFDKDEDFFAVGGALKEIQIFPYNYKDVENEVENLEYSSLQTLSSTSEISALSWSRHSRGQIASADLNGNIYLWDANSASLLTEYTDHKKKIYSIDYSHTEVGVLASASEDFTVRLWDVAQPKEVGLVITPSAATSVRFNPVMPYTILISCSNSLAYCYDTRKLDNPLVVLSEHAKAITGISFLNRKELTTSSLDGTVKLWDLDDPSKSVRTYKGHVNENQYCGMHAINSHIAIGGENNVVNIYNKELSTPILDHSFASGSFELDRQKFVSAVCWNKHANVLLAGNNSGVVKLLKLS